MSTSLACSTNQIITVLVVNHVEQLNLDLVLCLEFAIVVVNANHVRLAHFVEVFVRARVWDHYLEPLWLISCKNGLIVDKACWCRLI